MSLEVLFECPLPNGIHARPASILEELCRNFKAEIYLENLRNGERASMASVLAMISADILFDDSCRITIAGEDSYDAFEKLSYFIQNDFHNCDEALLQRPAEIRHKLPRSLLLTKPDYIPAISVSEGIATAKPIILGRSCFSAEMQEMEGQDIAIESKRLQDGLQSLGQFISDELGVAMLEEQSSECTQTQILRAHLAIVKDQELAQRLVKNLELGVNVSCAQSIINTVDYFNQRLGNAENVYLQERALDLQDIGSQLMCQLYGDEAVSKVDSLSQASIVITSTLTPSSFIALNGPYLKGLVLESGGRTSHTVLLARAAGIPVLVGAENAVDFCRGLDSVTIDSNLGILLRNTLLSTKRYYELEKKKTDSLASRYQQFKHSQASTYDGKAIEIAANIASSQEAKRAFLEGADSIGLFRTEMLFMDRSTAPSEQEQYLCYQESLQAANGNPVIIRTFDVGGDKPISYFNIGKEENPFLGYRAVRTYPDLLPYFTTQLRSLARAAVFGNLRIMIPMISCVEEMRWVRETFEKVIEQLQLENIECAMPQLGMMIEIPSAVFMIDQLAHYADFFSIGSNDLTQYFLACDRGNKRLASLYSNYHPSFIRLLKQVVDEAKTAERWVGLCGEMAADSQLLPLLVGLGLDEVSMAAPGIAKVKTNVSSLNYQDCNELVERVMACADIESVKAQLHMFHHSSLSKPLLEKSLIITDSVACNRAESIKILADNLHVQGRALSSEAIEEALWQREDMFSTGLGFGIAIPHCKTDDVTHNSISLLRLQKPIEWEEGGEPVDVVFMLAVKESDGGAVHMKYFSKLARKMVHKSFREELRSLKDSFSLLTYLHKVLEL
jgi:fructose-specific PTS system IIA-like component